MSTQTNQIFDTTRNNESGVTLIELMIALFVFTLGALAVTAMCLLSIQGNALANRMTQASLLAQDKMEALISSDVAALADGGEVVDENGVTGVGGSYSRDWLVTDNNPADDTRWLTVTVSWSDAKGNHQVELRSRTRGD